MKYSRSIKIKALVLSAVFSLNTVVGFACSIGLDLGYNSSHHKKAVFEIPEQSHENSCHHQHKPVAAKKATHSHDDGVGHGHHNDLQNEEADSNDLPADDCCSNEVYKFNDLTKNITQGKTGNKFQVLSATPNSHFGQVVWVINEIPLLHSSRFLFPPPPDILVSIQKFQI
ncbi:MAG: hypothetical protein FJY20_00570 [Bacteroidetes bacterium]|nr:hypothetical protein [Bacteroidota bacterium]